MLPRDIFPRTADLADPQALRGFVVRRVLTAQISLAVLLYLLVGYILIKQGQDAVPDALWLAAGAASAPIFSFLSNSKGGSEGGTGDKQEVYATEPLPVQYEDPTA